jgi:CBS domain-containing membrane protein
VGAFVGLLLVVIAAKFLGEFSGIDEWLMASLGASALLVFAYLKVRWHNLGL